jgi:hypothetical protein
MPLEELASVQVITFPSKPWWGADCPRLFDSTMPGSLVGRVQHTYQAISLNISGLVLDQQYLSFGRGVPIDLKTQSERYSKLPVRIENDTVAWARGAVALQARLGSLVEYPGLFVTFGTCPGASVMLDSSHSLGIELYLVDWPFSSTNACRGDQPEPWDEHDQALFRSSMVNKETASACELLCDSAVKWIRSQGFEDQKVRQIFTTRVSSYLHDIMESLEERLKIQVKMVFVGGGNAEWLNSQLSEAMTMPVHVLNSTALKTHGISPDLISLMSSIDGICETSTATVFPERERVVSQMQALHEECSKVTPL